MPRSKAIAKKAETSKPMEAVKKNNLASQKIARKSAPVTTGVKNPLKKKRSRPGQAALREIKQYQKSTENLIQRAPLHRRIRQIAHDYASGPNEGEFMMPNRSTGFRFQPQALEAIQQALEATIISLYEDANLCTNHAKRMTLFETDIRLAMRIRGTQF